MYLLLELDVVDCLQDGQAVTHAHDPQFFELVMLNHDQSFPIHTFICSHESALIRTAYFKEH